MHLGKRHFLHNQTLEVLIQGGQKIEFLKVLILKGVPNLTQDLNKKNTVGFFRLFFLLNREVHMIGLCTV